MAMHGCCDGYKKSEEAPQIIENAVLIDPVLINPTTNDCGPCGGQGDTGDTVSPSDELIFIDAFGDQVGDTIRYITPNSSL